MGQTESVMDLGDGPEVVYFHGRNLAREAIKQLVGNKTNQQIASFVGFTFAIHTILLFIDIWWPVGGSKGLHGDNRFSP